MSYPREIGRTARRRQRGAPLGPQRHRPGDALQHRSSVQHRRSGPARAHVARYAWGDDYHQVLMRRMDALVAWMHEVHPEPVRGRALRRYRADSGAGVRAGMRASAGSARTAASSIRSWARSSSCRRSSAACRCSLTRPRSISAACARCACEACPTQALVAPGVLDARRCISYLTIEQQQELPAALKPAVGTHVYGCDICQEVCPYNSTAPESADPAWLPRAVWDGRRVDELLHLADADLRAALVNSAMTRARTAGLRRNFRVAAENAGGEDTFGR